MRKKNKIIGRGLLLIFCIMLLFGSLSMVGLAAGDIKIVVMQNGQPLSEKSYSTQQLLDFGTAQAAYSSIDSSGSPELTSAQGVSIAKLLAGLGINAADVDSIRFSASDGWNRSYTKKFLLDTQRYYYAGLSAAKTVAEDGTVTYDSAKLTPIAVESMLAVQSYSQRDAAAEDYSKLSSANGVRICFGQQSYDEVVSTKFGRNINKLEINLNSGASYNGGGSENNGGDDENNQNSDPNKQETYNGEIPGELTITVGYYGGEYTVKKKYSAADLQAMANYKQSYTYIDSMPAVCIDSAYGVK
ncbi:MAG: hypothetical protein ACOX7J_04420, partial [Bacillota bacterium]